MKTYRQILITALTLLFYLNSNAQSNTTDKKALKNYCIIKINNSEELHTRYFIMDPNQIEKLDVLSKHEGEKVYGKVGADVFYVVTPKPSVKFLNKTQIFKLFKIDDKYLNLPILIDGEKATDSENLLATNGTISKISVNKESGVIDITTVFKQNKIKFEKEARKAKEQRLKEMQKN